MDTRSHLDSCCFVCKATLKLKYCNDCKLRGYCSKEHQTADWKRHKPECKRIQQLKTNPELLACWQFFDEMDEKKTGILEGDVAQSFVSIISDLILTKALDEENLEQLFRAEFGDSVAVPPATFFKKQKEDAVQQFKTDLWNQVDPQKTGGISWDAFEKFFSIVSQQND